ncbi:hypothetical protein A3A93_02900 [Candidatus Roizmanbacteria bacterium RIFCSPLOWO2_01_FULL_38_12]|uniref:ATP synthase F1 complex delta/epsilon subunit N-terminal domain-containing protein n=1 Tax=Candidatus Roizmanbacteria bacterium RIFCSPLOWO2_01_FULL_38_12 TaxID=1802061 RepID=A0A1F7IZK3_9BACT|nr:MAG: hypothetical protein A3F59_05990 [Candidatus Roizmanbacteria bacterium RIFCSPHIGHO2_12_FULL_38_13]OGK48755.1 MAG: hypothetical protein A3A93_02900 [Candidatus Roizmanbacteria bacterium RIFCSPLOWO2_01_FULL_38_12]
MQQPNVSQPVNLQISILSPDKIIYLGQAEAVTCKNEKGVFDILPLHSNFISLIDDYIIIHLPRGREHKIKIGRGLLKAIENKITILLNIDLTEKDVIFKALFKQIEDNQKKT